jgi:cysteine-rich repeat protein
MCGDGVISRAAGEQCDDDSTINGDGCTAPVKLQLYGNGIRNTEFRGQARSAGAGDQFNQA